MKYSLRNISHDIAHLYYGKNLYWQIGGIFCVIVLVLTNTDWNYFLLFRNSVLYPIFIYAGLLGFFVPPIMVFGLWIYGWYTKKRDMVIAGWMVMYAGIVGWCMSSLYKFFTGRMHPPYLHANSLDFSLVNNMSQQFQFGLGQGGIFWGWPSSHTTTAFAMMIALAVFYKKRKWVGIIAIIYACYIAIGASFSFHWLSDVVFGVILGVMIGVVVGNRFAQNKNY